MKLSGLKQGRIILYSLGIFLLSLTSGQTEICNPDPKGNPQPPHTLQDVLKSAQILRSLDNQNGEPNGLTNHLTELRDKMATYALECLNEDAKNHLPVSHTQQRINSDFKSVKLDDGGLTDVKVKETGDDTACVFADSCAIELEPVVRETDYVALKTYISIYCGTEIGFALLRQKGDAWEPILCDFTLNENQPKSFLRYSIFHSIKDKADYVAVARLSTWCQSEWMSTHLTIFRIENGWSNSIFNYDITTVTDSDNYDDNMKLNRLTKGFSITVQNDEGGEEPGFRFEHIYEFTIKNHKVSNVAIKSQKPKY